MNDDLHLSTPSHFPAFPYCSPYAIQTQLMRHLYETIEQRKVSIIESPTGTGKTLSLLCASLTWLSDDRERAKRGKLKEMIGGEDSGAKSWVFEQALARVRRDMELDEKEHQARLTNARKREEELRRAAGARVVKRQRMGAKEAYLPERDIDDHFLPEEDRDGAENGEMHISPALRALMERVDKGRKPTKLLTVEDPACMKIFYASRTHSQLSQILLELRKLKLDNITLADLHPASPPPIPSKRAAEEDTECEEAHRRTTRTVSLGSRKQLCINDQLRLKATDLDEACRELLAENEEKRCPYLPPLDDESRMLDLRDQILAVPKDIEDLAVSGRLSNTCPYFGSRRAIPQAELVTLPYNLLLQKSAREALGIDLKDQIVLIDEAHNLIPTLLSLSTVRLTHHTLQQAFQQVCTYVSRFKLKLSPVNLLHLKRLVTFLDAINTYIGQWKDERSKDNSEKTEVMKVGDLIGRLGKKIAGINLMEIEAYLKKSKIARKIAGYSDSQAEKSGGMVSFNPKKAIRRIDKGNTDSTIKEQVRKGLIPPLHVVEDFMLALMSTNEDGRVTLQVVNSTGRESTVEMKFQLLNPSPHFREVVEAARSVVLAGGTMSPIQDVINQLLSYLPEDRITSFSCGHIVPKENLQTLVIAKGPSGAKLEFKSEKQKDITTVSQLGQLLSNFVNIIPAGMIVFFPSYRFLKISKELWTKSGMLDKFGRKKWVFFEPEDGSVEQVLQQYAAAATKPTDGKNGALLFAVIGAKLSEGLNFADDLARGVAIIGLPFANLGSPELRERLEYVKRLEAKQNGPKPGKKDAAAELYENMCMNAVNQSIGRAIRHKGDWASLLLVDQRYSSIPIQSKLPKWIEAGLVVPETFGQTVKEMASFFRDRRR